MIKPRSILQLTVTGFLAVTGILITALLITMQQLDELSDRGQSAVNQTTVAMDASRTLLQQSTAMERNARQFSVVGDMEILDVYAERHETFVTAAHRLRALDLSAELGENTDAILQLEDAAFQRITQQSTIALESNYQELVAAASRIADEVNRWANGQGQSIAQESADARRLLTIQAIALVASALALAGIFTALITRPLLQVEKVIERLGKGRYAETIAINGPSDLVELGVRLEWLRGRLSKLEQQRSSFLRHVSHELKSPLAAIQESIALFREGIVGELSDEQKKIIQIQSNSTQRLHQLIDDLLRHHEKSFDGINAQSSPVALHHIIEQGIVNHGPNILAKSIVMETDLEKLEILGNAEQIRVVVDNLLSNAIRYSPDQGRIGITLNEQDGDIVIVVADQGPGIAAKDIEQVFEAFYQGVQPLNSNYRGSGLGLAITQEYVAANGGIIQVLPSARGARFEVRFPGTHERREPGATQSGALHAS